MKLPWTDKIIKIALVVNFTWIVRWSLSVSKYSGEGLSPKFGDFEAQRHWMEITTSLPMNEWYKNSTRNDLEYWGLDYPPLSAFHSYLMGKLIQFTIPEAIQLHVSRGFESLSLKLFMRITVFISDILIFALIYFHCFYFPNKNMPEWVKVLMALSAPPLFVIDYGHFQYNCVSLGLTVIAVMAYLTNQMVVSGILFTMAINHKQMSLYHALPFFIGMIATAVFREMNLKRTIKIGLGIILTLAILWFPFRQEPFLVLERIFPLKRGVFEDKVGTFWYVFDRIAKVKLVEPGKMAKLCAATLLISTIPTMCCLFYEIMTEKAKKKSHKSFLLCLFNTSLAFFLFSFHVHEKSIMLPVLSAVLILQWYPFEACWFITAASMSLYPLFHQEEAKLSIIIPTAIFVTFTYFFTIFRRVNILLSLLFSLSIISYVSLVFCLEFKDPPPHLPHLFQALFAIISFAHYFLFFLYFVFVQIVRARNNSLLVNVHKAK